MSFVAGNDEKDGIAGVGMLRDGLCKVVGIEVITRGWEATWSVAVNDTMLDVMSEEELALEVAMGLEI